MKIKKYLKDTFPELFHYYLYFLERKKIKDIEKLKAIPESQYPKLLAKIYKNFIGLELDWDNLSTYTEKMQWAKLYDKNPLKTTLTDKYLVRKWVEEKIGEEYLIPLIGVWDKFDDIDFSTLPDQFVLKTNHGSGTNLIVKNKAELNQKRAKQRFDNWMQIDYAFRGYFEMHYSNIKPKIIAEQYIETPEGDLPDYKFLCFNGKAYYCWVDKGRFRDHTRNVYDLEWNLQPWSQAHPISDMPIEKPQNFEKMIELVESLADQFSHVRVDFYNIEGKLYFGEMTFTNASGLEVIYPHEYDRHLGELWNIP